MIRERNERFAQCVLGACVAFEALIVLMLLWNEWRRDDPLREPTQVLPSPAEEFNTEYSS